MLTFYAEIQRTRKRTVIIPSHSAFHGSVQQPYFHALHQWWINLKLNPKCQIPNLQVLKFKSWSSNPNPRIPESQIFNTQISKCSQTLHWLLINYLVLST